MTGLCGAACTLGGTRMVCVLENCDGHHFYRALNSLRVLPEMAHAPVDDLPSWIKTLADIDRLAVAR